MLAKWRVNSSHAATAHVFGRFGGRPPLASPCDACLRYPRAPIICIKPSDFKGEHQDRSSAGYSGGGLVVGGGGGWGGGSEHKDDDAFQAGLAFQAWLCISHTSGSPSTEPGASSMHNKRGSIRCKG